MALPSNVGSSSFGKAIWEVLTAGGADLAFCAASSSTSFPILTSKADSFCVVGWEDIAFSIRYSNFSYFLFSMKAITSTSSPTHENLLAPSWPWKSAINNHSILLSTNLSPFLISFASNPPSTPLFLSSPFVSWSSLWGRPGADTQRFSTSWRTKMMIATMTNEFSSFLMFTFFCDGVLGQTQTMNTLTTRTNTTS